MSCPRAGHRREMPTQPRNSERRAIIDRGFRQPGAASDGSVEVTLGVPQRRKKYGRRVVSTGTRKWI